MIGLKTTGASGGFVARVKVKAKHDRGEGFDAREKAKADLLPCFDAHAFLFHLAAEIEAAVCPAKVIDGKAVKVKAKANALT